MDSCDVAEVEEVQPEFTDHTDSTGISVFVF